VWPYCKHALIMTTHKDNQSTETFKNDMSTANQVHRECVSYPWCPVVASTVLSPAAWFDAAPAVIHLAHATQSEQHTIRCSGIRSCTVSTARPTALIVPRTAVASGASLATLLPYRAKAARSRRASRDCHRLQRLHCSTRDQGRQNPQSDHSKPDAAAVAT